jgi:hypothetical protein
MAIYDPKTGQLRGKVGQMVYEVNKEGTNYVRSYSPRRRKKTALQDAHFRLYGQLQGLGSIWNHTFIKPYYKGDPTRCAYRQFIKHNWALWDKIVPAWTVALPFWGYAPAPKRWVFVSAYHASLVTTVPAVSCVPRIFKINSDMTWEELAPVVVGAGYRVEVSDVAGYRSSWNFMLWFQDSESGMPCCDPVRE